VSAVPISGTKELASRTTNIAWRTRSNTFVLFPLLELTHAVAQHHAGFVLKLHLYARICYPHVLGLFFIVYLLTHFAICAPRGTTNAVLRVTIHSKIRR
jgi:hypothetical protein